MAGKWPQNPAPQEPWEREIVDRHNSLEEQQNAIADQERPSTTTPKPLNRYLGRDVLAFATNQNKVQRQQLAAEHRAKVLGDKNHSYRNASSTEHKAAVVGMKVAIDIIQTGDSSAQINPDGSIGDE
jgi:hypothetical protein